MAVLTNWLNKLVKAIALLNCITGAASLQAQSPSTISLVQAFNLAQQNYPLIRQKGLLQQTEQLSIENLSSNFLPQLVVNGQATYQSDVTSVSIPLPDIKIPVPAKDQYRITAEADQLLYDGGLNKAQKQIQSLNTAVQENALAVELHNLKTRVNQLYFSILYQDELLKQTDITLQNIQAGINKTKPQVESGVALRSNLQVLQAQLLQTQQRTIEIKATRKGLTDALAVFINQPISENTLLKIPADYTATDTINNRPELQLYKSQSLLAAGKERLVNTRNLPKATAFFQGGYGRPALNVLSNEFKPFYITGLRLNWSLGSLYNHKRDKKLIDINQQTIDLQKDVFLLNTQSQLQQQKADIDKYKTLVATDNEIIQLRKQITEAAKAQLENAVITANDFLIQINAEDAARQSLVLHQLQLRQAQINYAITTGKL
ncbi:TolC family protein [Ilyomonas limi]|uniref:TolC family protein n=1 Tax=Ilyomonas limi TaxID=2575867 RepID=A0A4U3L6W8_9BACT|nr:TolC family protein [Ilyomonas limi]TKK70995.1 TolC family protein [Ilyomonas limi]